MTIEPVGGEGFEAGRWACVNLIHAYNNFADTARHAMIPELFTDDAVLNANDEMVGIESIREGMRKRAANARKTLHVSANIQFTDLGASELRATSTLAVHVFQDPPKTLGPAMMVRVLDAFIRLPNGEWRFRRRDFEIFARAG